MAELTVSGDGRARWQDQLYRCALGRGGLVETKREGDGGTPVGRFPLRQVFYRADRVAGPDTGLPTRALLPGDAWCEDPADPSYNRLVDIGEASAHDRLWREDGIYDVIVVVGHNDDPPVPGRGSAIFLHVARAGFSPTAGCVAFALPDLLELLATADHDTILAVVGPRES